MRLRQIPLMRGISGSRKQQEVKDMRMKFVDEDGTAKVQEGQSGVKKDQGVARAISVGDIVQSGSLESNVFFSRRSSTPASHGRISPGSGV